MMMVLKTIGAYAVLRPDPAAGEVEDQPQILTAVDTETLQRAIATRWVATWNPEHLPHAASIRDAIMAEEWGEMVRLFMLDTGQIIDTYPNILETAEPHDFPADSFGMQIQLTPLFTDER